MKILGNIIWLLFGGIIIAIEYLIGSLLLMLTIIGIPFGLQTLKLASLALWPFGRNSIVMDNASGCVAIAMNILWLFVGGDLYCPNSCHIWVAFIHNHYRDTFWKTAF